jgi:16S rRNA (cytosine967-C5)-methyltransferase
LNAREVTLKALLHVDENEGYSNLVLDKALRTSGLSVRDKALTAALFYGVLERRITLDTALRQYLRSPQTHVDAAVWEILRMAAYQIYYMDRIPDSAAVNEAVTLTRKIGKNRAAGFVNGVLRSLLRQKENRPFPPKGKDRLESLSIQNSCPAWLIARWEAAYGVAVTEQMLACGFQRPPLYARVNSLKTTPEKLTALLQEEEIEAQAVTWLPNALKLNHTGSIAEGKCFQEGLFHIQDLSSQFGCCLLGAKPGERIYDVCAAPGGKTFTIAQEMQNRGEIRAFDQYRGKVGLIQKGSQRLGITNVSAAVRDAARDSALLPPADRVLCDVPCSGYGILRRKPEIRYKSRETIDSLPDLQYGILCKSSNLLRPGGILLYSTCTLNPAENSQNARRFLQEHPNFTAAPLTLPAAVSHTIAEPENQLTLFPQANDTDGFFISLFRKEE